MICLQTPSFGWSFQDGRQLASKPVHHNNELLDPVLFLRSVEELHCGRSCSGSYCAPEILNDVKMPYPRGFSLRSFEKRSLCFCNSSTCGRTASWEWHVHYHRAHGRFVGVQVEVESKHSLCGNEHDTNMETVQGDGESVHDVSHEE